jgi:DNA polymerase I-like protein with 3'-5' exonuclease and polymerase domains
VESPVKALALQDHGLNAVGLGGVATTLTKDGKLNDSWKDVAVFHRDVFIVFDANRQNNVAVARAEARLVLSLETAGARVQVVALPLLDGGGDQGPDDFLAAHDHDAAPLFALIAAALPGDPVERAKGVSDKVGALTLLEDLPFLLAAQVRGAVVIEKIVQVLSRFKVTRMLVRQAIKRALASDKNSGANLPVATRYDVRDGGLCLVVSDGVNERTEPLANFEARVVEERMLDDGSGAPTRVFVLEGALQGGELLEPVSVTPQQFVGDLWPVEKWGTRVVVSAAITRSAHHLRNAITVMSDSTSRVVAYTHTGFRQKDGSWFYLHGGGAVGASDVTVALEGPAKHFVLPEQTIDVVGAVKESLAFLDVGVHRVTYPLHAAVYRAPLNEALICDAVVALYGDTGTLKSATMAVAQSHYGDFDYNSLPLNWESTANSLEYDIFRLKDVFTTIDEFVPKGVLYEELQRKAERVVRAIGNGNSRGRLNSDLSARPERPCRALVGMTGEELPRGESVQARLIGIRAEHGNVSPAKLSARQQNRGRLAHAMRAYVEWVATQMPHLKVGVRQSYLALRDQMHAAGHLRAPSAMAHLLVGAYYFAAFAKDIGVMTEADAKAHVECTRAALLENAREQVRATELSNPARRFMDVLRSLYARKAIVLKSRGESLRPFNMEGGAEVGWKDDKLAYMDVNAIQTAVSRELTVMGERQPLSSHGLWKQMAAQGFIVPNGDDMTPKVYGDKVTRVRVIRVPLALLKGQPDPGPGGGDGDGDGVEGDGEGGDVDGDVDPTCGYDWPPPDGPSDDGPLRSARWFIGSPRPANDPAAQKAQGRPEVSELLGGAGSGQEPSANPELGASKVDSNEPSAQEPKRLRERRIEASAFCSPQEARPEQCTRNPYIEGSLSQGNSWALGRTSGRSSSIEAFAGAMLAAGRVGIATSPGGDGSLLALALANGSSLIVELQREPLVPLADALGQATLVGHDLRDIVALLQAQRIHPTQVFDTAVAWKLQDGGRHDDERYFSLDNLVRIMGMSPPVSQPGTEERLEEEARKALVLEEAFRTLLEEDGLTHVAELEHALLPVVTEIEASGVPVDGAAWKRVTIAWATEAETLRKSISESLGIKNVDDDKQVLAALQRLGLAVERTSGEALAQYSDHPIVSELTRYRRRIGFVRSSGKAVLEALARSTDGRVRTTIHQLGARTGRMSCEQPNLMGLPRDAEIRACIVAPPGMKLVIGDYKAIEMRVIADQTGDPELRNVFASPTGDPHKHTASIMLGKPESQIDDDEKKPAKPMNFGICFGMKPPSLVTYARKNFSVVFTLAQAEQFGTAFLNHYKGIREWHERTEREMPPELRTASGRVTYYPYSDEGFNARLSFPIQGTAADGLKAAVVMLHPRLRRLGARIILVVHDELLIECPEEHAEEVKALMRECMIAGMARYVPSVPIAVEPKVRSTWAE